MFGKFMLRRFITSDMALLLNFFDSLQQLTFCVVLDLLVDELSDDDLSEASDTGDNEDVYSSLHSDVFNIFGLAAEPPLPHLLNDRSRPHSFCFLYALQSFGADVKFDLLDLFIELLLLQQFEFSKLFSFSLF